MGKKTPKPPKIFHVNWFRTDANGKFIWPGFGENLRVLLWILDRTEGKGEAVKTPIGFVPAPEAINVSGLGLSKEVVANLLSVDRSEWKAEVEHQNEFFSQVGGRLPKEISEEQKNLRGRLD